MNAKILYASEPYFPSFHEALSRVARERIYIEMTEAPPLASVAEFQATLVKKNAPVYYAVDGERVVGWCDISPRDNPRQNHRGSLGMGLIPEARGFGLGSSLMEAALLHAARCGLEKVELSVYTSNLPAIGLYRKHGFAQEGLVRSYRKLDGQVFDCLVMGKFLHQAK